MSDERDDAAPTREGQAVTPQSYVCFGFGPDGNFFLDVQPPDNELLARATAQMGGHELDRYFVNLRMKAMLDKAQQTAVLNGMMGDERKKIDRRLRG